MLACFDRPGTSNGPTEAIIGRLKHLRGTALGVRNLTNYIASDPEYTFFDEQGRRTSCPAWGGEDFGGCVGAGLGSGAWCRRVGPRYWLEPVSPSMSMRPGGCHGILLDGVSNPVGPVPGIHETGHLSIGDVCLWLGAIALLVQAALPAARHRTPRN